MSTPGQARPSDPAASAEPPPRRSARGERTRERILDAAEALFAERGFAGTTLRDVAEAVELRIPSLYNHFESKDALYAAVLERGVQPVLELLLGMGAMGRGADGAGVVREVMALLARRPALPRLLLHETLGGGERLTPALRAWIAPVFERANALLEESSSARRWDREQLPLLVLTLYHEIVGYFTIAPLYEALNGQRLLEPEALETHTRFLTELLGVLLPDPEGSEEAAPPPSRPRR